MLSQIDRSKLLEILIPLSVLSNERGRESVLVSADLIDIRPQIDTSGPSAIAIPLMINFLETYGRVSQNHHALGRFLNSIKDLVGIEQSSFLGYIINEYKLMIPNADNPGKIIWKAPINNDMVLEKIIGENTLRSISFLELGLQKSKSIAYIEVNLGGKSWSGTGFLVGDNLLITNNHVLPEKDLLEKTLFRFNYQLDVNGNAKIHKDYYAEKNGFFHTNEEMDFSIVELTGLPGVDWGFLSVTNKSPILESRVNIIQHPNGLPKQISFQNNFVKYVDNKVVQYITSTQPGSSGSPVLNDEWLVVGVHHSGGWLPQGDKGPICYMNEGITIASILSILPESIRGKFSVVE